MDPNLIQKEISLCLDNDSFLFLQQTPSARHHSPIKEIVNELSMLRNSPDKNKLSDLTL